MRFVALILTALPLFGCAVPLGPGFSQSYRAVNVSATSIEPTHIHVQVTDKLENIGNRGLRYLDVTLPAGPSFGTHDVSISLAAKPIATQVVMRQSGPSFRVPFDPQWPPGETRQIAFAYDLEPSTEGRGVVAATANDFYLADPNVFPSWQAPVGPFAQASLRANTELLEVAVPVDFHVLAVGRPRGSDRRGESAIYRFEMLGAEFPPYLIAGRYEEQRAVRGNRTVIFWTRESLDEATARVVAQRITSTVQTYEDRFGPVTKERFPIHIVETSAELAPIGVLTPNISAASFPDGILFDHRAVALGLATGPVLDLADYELARTWFGWHVRPRPEADLLLGRGMALFATLLAAEGRGGAAVRDNEILRLISVYDTIAGAPQKPGFGPALDYTREEQQAKAYKAALFLAALEDITGKERFYRAVRRILTDMAGQEIGSDELRSALEAEAGRNLAPVFHAWFDYAGLPPQFRARYTAQRSDPAGNTN